jgi:hypothetical protein
MTILGYNTIGASANSGWNNLLCACGPWPLASSGLIASFSAYLSITTAPYPNNLLIGVYDNTGSSGYAGNLISSIALQSWPGNLTAGWYTFSPLTANVPINAGSYYLGFWGSSNWPNIQYDAKGAGWYPPYNPRFFTGATLSGGTTALPSTFGTSTPSSYSPHSIYATINPASNRLPWLLCP